MPRASDSQDSAPKRSGLPDFPPGMVPRVEAARMFGVGLRAWGEWERAGRVSIPRYTRKLSRGRPWVLYKAADVLEQRERLRRLDDAGINPMTGKPLVPEGLVSRHEAARLFGFSSDWWGDWENLGRMPVRCVWVPSGKGAPYKMYPLDELLEFREELRRRQAPRPDPSRPGCYLVPLVHRTYDPREAIIDAESLPLVEGRNWHWEPRDDGHVGCVALASTIGPNTPLKRIVMGVEDAGPELRVMHANGDPLDCRRANLVVKSIEEQCYGNRKRGLISGRKYTSDYKGVSWDEPRGKWKAQIQQGGVNRYIGRYDEEEDAALAYDHAARAQFGEHARLNFPAEPAEAAARAAA